MSKKSLKEIRRILDTSRTLGDAVDATGLSYAQISAYHLADLLILRPEGKNPVATYMVMRPLMNIFNADNIHDLRGSGFLGQMVYKAVKGKCDALDEQLRLAVSDDDKEKLLRHKHNLLTTLGNAAGDGLFFDGHPLSAPHTKKLSAAERYRPSNTQREI